MSNNAEMGVPFSESCPTSVAYLEDEGDIAGLVKSKKGKRTVIAGQKRITRSITEKSVSLQL